MGYGGVTDNQGTSLETITWATGLLAQTQRVTIFGTVHVPLFHPLIAAKQMVTADHVARGRFGLNIVAGWNEDEFRMFGVSQKDHDARYEYAQEWVDIVKATWERDDFDYDGEFFHLKGVRQKPKPYGGTRPIIMNAGQTPVGRAFATRNTDMYFTAKHAKLDIQPIVDEVKLVKAAAHEGGREMEVFTAVHIVCRPTREEAEAYVRHAIDENADWGALEKILAVRARTVTDPADLQKLRADLPRVALGVALIGTPDDVAQALGRYSDAGIRGVGMTFVNFVDELPYFCDEVLPRLERTGHRVP